MNTHIKWKDAALGYVILAIPAALLLAIFWSKPAGPPDSPAATPWTTVSVPPVAPYTGPMTVCVDGWISHSTGRGTCSHHGGER